MSYSFYGASDDCAEVEGSDGFREEVSTNGNGVLRWRLGEPDAGVLITASYGDGDGAVWAFKVEQLDEGIKVPWAITVGPGHDYSLRVTVDCPLGTRLAYQRGRLSGKALTWTDEVVLVGMVAR